LNALNPTDREKVIVVGTRKHLDDWYGQLLINPYYKRRVDTAFLDDDWTECLWPNILDEEGEIIVPAFTRERLMERKEEIGALQFAQEYMNAPSPPEGLLFKTEWLRFYEHLPDHSFIKYFMGIDPSHGDTKGSKSFFALCVIAYDRLNNKSYVCDFYRDKLSEVEQVRKSIEYAEKYKIDAFYIEAVFKYTHVYDAMRDRFHNVYPIDYVHTRLKGTTVLNKHERIQNVCGPAIELGKVYFKRPELDPYTKTFLNNEYIAFPHGQDDMFDALTLAIHRVIGLRTGSEQPFFFPNT